MKLKKFEGNPILSPLDSNDWESLVTCNPGVVYDNGTFYMLYRAAGNDAEHVIRLGLATSKDGFHFERVSDVPVFGPSEDGPDSGCVEDPRIVKYDTEYYITYAYRPYAPGQYWNFSHDEVLLPDCGSDAPMALRKNLGNTGLAVTTDFREFKRLGRLTSPVLDDRDVILFPEKVLGALLLDLENPLHILAKTPQPILEPELDFETSGLYNGCVFPTGNVIVDGELFVYYGSADKYVCVATCAVDELLDYLLSDSCRLH